MMLRSYPSFHNFDVREMALTFWRESGLGASCSSDIAQTRSSRQESLTRFFSAPSPERFLDYSVAVRTPLAVGNVVSLTSGGFVGEAGGKCVMAF